jgi:hypothetical protein
MALGGDFGRLLGHGDRVLMNWISAQERPLGLLACEVSERDYSFLCETGPSLDTESAEAMTMDF